MKAKSMILGLMVAAVAPCVLSPPAEAGDCRGVLQIQSQQVYAQPVQFQQQYVQPVQVQRFYQPQQVQFVQRQHFRQRVRVVQQPVFVQQQPVFVRQRRSFLGSGGGGNLNFGLININ